MVKLSFVSLVFCLMLAPLSVSAETITVLNPSGIRVDGRYVDRILTEIMQDNPIPRLSRAGDFPDSGLETIEVQEDAWFEVNKLFYHRGWTDGLPIVPPTPERVAAMLKGTDLLSYDVVTLVEPMLGEATVEKIAINAVMAGCQPAYMPILIAAVEAINSPDTDLRGSATSTSPDEPLLIVSGPMVAELGINNKGGAFGQGWQPNATIGRAFHLILRNVGGNWPQVTDMASLGQPGAYSMFIAENSPVWDPLHTTLGLPKEANTVTVVTVEGYHGLVAGRQPAENLLRMVADKIKSDNWPVREEYLVILAQNSAARLIQDGWTRETAAEFIMEHAKVRLEEFTGYFVQGSDLGGRILPWVYSESDPETMVPRPFLDRVHIMVAGGVGEKNMVLPVWHMGQAISREVKLPKSWTELLRWTDGSPLYEK